jgi:hypothetical protein
LDTLTCQSPLIRSPALLPMSESDPNFTPDLDPCEVLVGCCPCCFIDRLPTLGASRVPVPFALSAMQPKHHFCSVSVREQSLQDFQVLLYPLLVETIFFGALTILRINNIFEISITRTILVYNAHVCPLLVVYFSVGCMLVAALLTR